MDEISRLVLVSTCKDGVPVYLVVGLGNPGPDYDGTRHNVGFQAADLFAGRHDIEMGKKKFSSHFGKGRVKGRDVLVAKPQTFMNLSGRSVAEIVRFFRVDPENLLVLHDDMDIETGRIKIAGQGGAGGHNGVASIIEALGHGNFARVKIGVGRPDRESGAVGHVLGRFSEEESELMRQVLDRVAAAAEWFVDAGLGEAQTRFNRRYQNKE